MNRSLLLTAILAVIVSPHGVVAQALGNLPVLRPKVTELGGFRDTTALRDLVPDEAVPSPRGTLIAYTTSNDLRLWNVSTRSSRIVIDGWSESVAWSPNGDAIAFAHHTDKSGPEAIWIQRVNPVTGESIGAAQRVTLAPSNGDGLRFSPDGKSIAFPRHDVRDRYSLTVVPAAGGTERVLASGFDIGKLRWSADGNSIYYVSYLDSAGRKPVLSVVSAAGGTPKPVHDFSRDRISPTLSIDTRVAAFFWDDPDSTKPAWVSDLAGRPLATLSIPINVRVGDWSASYRLAGVRETHTRGLRVINVADGKSRVLIDSTADVQAAAWFGDSRRVAAIVFYDTLGVLVTMNADGSGMRKLPLATRPYQTMNVGHGFAQSLRVSPDGRYAVYQGPGRRSLELVNLSSGEQRTLVRAAVIEPPVWRHDSRTIRYDRLVDVSLEDSTWRTVHDVSVDGTDKFVRAFTHAQYPNAAWVISDDYASVFMEKNRTAIARFDGSPDQLLLHTRTRTPGVASPDGRTIALNVSQDVAGGAGRRLVLVSVSDGSQRTLNLPFVMTAGCSFSPEGRHLYCMGREGANGPQTLWDVPVDETTPRRVSSINSREYLGVNALSPDGKWFLHSFGDVRGSVFVSLDYTDEMTRVLSSSPQSSGPASKTRPPR